MVEKHFKHYFKLIDLNIDRSVRGIDTISKS